jgi:outer membrane protein
MPSGTHPRRAGPPAGRAALVLFSLASGCRGPVHDRPVTDGDSASPALPGAEVVPSAVGRGGRAARGPDLPQVLGVRDAVRIALERNPDLRTARARLEAARAGRAAAAAVLWPRLSLDAGLLHSNAPSTVLFKTIDAHELGANADFNSPDAIESTEAGLALSWNLWNGGRDVLLRDAAEQGALARGETLRAVRNGLVMSVIGACLDARAAEELLSADEASLRSVTAQLEDVRARVAQGAALRSDQLSLEVRLAEARERRLRTQLARRLALANLRGLLAWDSLGELVLAPVGSEGDLGPLDLPATLAEALDVARAERPEARVAESEHQRARLELAAARRAWLPRLEFALRWYGVENDVGLDFGEPNTTAALGLSWSLFEGGARRAALARARAQAAEAAAQGAGVESGVALEVETAWLRREEARARVEVAAQAVGASQEGLELVEKQFKAGSATVTRFLEAESGRTAAEASLIRSRIDLERSRIELARAIGLLSEVQP